MLEVLSYLQIANVIEDLSLDDFKNLLESDTKNFKNFTLKILAKDSIVVYNKTIGKNTRVKCVSNYYDLDSDNCMNIKSQKLGLEMSANCKQCHLACIKKHADGLIIKK